MDDLTVPIEGVRYRNSVVDFSDGVERFVRSSGWSLQKWTDPPGAYHSPHDHPYSHRVLARSGRIEFTVKGETYRLESGDSLDLPERVTHEAETHPERSTEYWLLRPGS